MWWKGIDWSTPGLEGWSGHKEIPDAHVQAKFLYHLGGYLFYALILLMHSKNFWQETNMPICILFWKTNMNKVRK